jgi:hypothetical protein
VDLLADAGQDEWVVLLDSDCFVHSNDWWPTLTAPMRGADPAVAAGPARHVSTDVSLVETWSTLVNLRHLASTGLSAVPFQTALGERYADTLDTALTCLQRLGHRVDTVPVAEHALHLGAVTVGAYFLDLFRRDHEAFRTLLDVFIPRERVDFMTASVCRSHELRVLFGDASADDAALERFAEVMECAETLAAQRDLLRHETEPRLREIGVLD